MTNPTPLSPAALAVWDAFNQFDHAGMHVDYGVKLAAALRAAADQTENVHPVNPFTEWGEGWLKGIQDAVAGLRRIATELEGAQ